MYSAAHVACPTAPLLGFTSASSLHGHISCQCIVYPRYSLTERFGETVLVNAQRAAPAATRPGHALLQWQPTPTLAVLMLTSSSLTVQQVNDNYNIFSRERFNNIDRRCYDPITQTQCALRQTINIYFLEASHPDFGFSE